MNYRHAFHAGNFADVVKHWALCLCLERLVQKPGPFRVLDLFAGQGIYDLDGPEALRSPEWRGGIGRMLDALAAAPKSEFAQAFALFRAAIAHYNPGGGARYYPGSPGLCLALMRAQDRLSAIEKHPEEAALLRDKLGRDPRLNALAQDGWAAGPKMVPPPEKRGLVLIDPPFEVQGEDRRLLETAAAIARKWPGGPQILWRPVKSRRAQVDFDAECRQSAIANVWRASLWVAAPENAQGLKAAALYFIRPPFGVLETLGRHLPRLADIMAETPEAGAELVEICPER